MLFDWRVLEQRQVCKIPSIWASKCFRACANARLKLSCAFAKYQKGLCSLYYPLILLADSEGPDQTARMHRLIWAFAVHSCPKTFSHGAALIRILKAGAHHSLQNNINAQKIIWSASAFTQWRPSYPWLCIECPVDRLIRLRACAGWP